MKMDRALSAREEWRAGWPLPIIGMFGNSIVQLFAYTSGIFLPPVTKEFGWTPTEFNAGLSFVMVVGVLMSPTFGLAVDRWGSRRLALIGIAGFTVLLASLALETGSIWVWSLHCLLNAVVATLISPLIWAKAIAGRFETSRALALAVMLSGLGFALAVYPLLATFYIQQFGWRLAYVALALSWGVPLLPLTYFFFRPDKGATSA